MKIEEVIKTSRFKDEGHRATINILYTAYWLKTHISSTMKSHDLTMEQFNVMRILKGKHPETMCVKDIASRMIEKSSNVPRIVDRLVNKKLVKRVTSKEDKRETLISLNEKGLQVLEAANKSIDNMHTAVLGISDKESEQLNMLLEKLRKID